MIRLRKGGNEASFTVRRIASNGIGVERTFLMRSPRIEKVVVERRAFQTTLARAHAAFARQYPDLAGIVALYHKIVYNYCNTNTRRM